MPTALVLIGLESVGKSALFRGLTGQLIGDEANVRGSTVVCRRAALPDHDAILIDTPGIRVESDSVATQAALAALEPGAAILVAARGNRALEEVDALRRRINLAGRRLVLVLTFADKCDDGLDDLLAHLRSELGIPVVAVNARNLSAEDRARLLAAADGATLLSANGLKEISSPVIATHSGPAITIYEDPHLGPWAAAATLILLFLLPVALAFKLSGWLQPLLDRGLLDPLRQWGATLPELLRALLVGDYGLLTLGSYSFLWAFPVVAFIGLGVAIGEEVGLKDRITTALDPWMRQIGLSGRDLVPVITGFGCNVVAVFQSRSCSLCHRKACVSLIAFGSACSYQIGASLSLFSSAGRPWLFLPYVTVLFLVGALHTRIWFGPTAERDHRPLAALAYLQMPRPAAIWWRLRAILRQFLWQAMPIFLLICAAAALLQLAGVLDIVARAIGPALRVFDLPGDVAPGIIFSVLRKDGLLVLNQGDGALLARLTVGQLFVLVYLASTLTSCMVTVFTIGRELGPRQALLVTARQVTTSLLSTAALAAVVRFL